jgi:hypothetical protein
MRPIDADRLKEVLNRNFGHTGGAKVMCQMIDKQPTVYDIDKIIKQLDKASDCYECTEQGREYVRMIDLTEAVEIVRGEQEWT